MARAVRHARRQARRLGLLTAALAACAVIEAPPGGPPDFAAPVLVSMTPDSGAVVPDWDDPVRIQFDEVISEQSGGGVDRLIQFSPRVEELAVNWKRSAIEVKPKDGWRAGVVYQVALLPGVTDLRNNRMEAGATVVFSTGTEIPNTQIAGTVIDWEDGRIAQNALIEASLLPDSLVYVITADSVGDFVLTSLPQGEYWVTAAIDANNSGRRDAREAFDSITVVLDSMASHDFWAFVRDTIGPQIRNVSYIDSLTIRVDFSQKLEPGEPDASAVTVFSLPDTIPVAVAIARSEAVQDSVVAIRQQAAADSAQAVADSARAAADTLEVVEDSVVAPEIVRPERERPAEAGADSTAAPPDSSRAERLLPERPVLSETWYIEMIQPLEAGARYLVEAIARNLSGATAQSSRLLLAPTPTPPDST